MSASLENSVDFEVVEPSFDHHDDDNRMYVSASTVGDTSSPANFDSEDDAVSKLSNSERNARLIGRRIDILTHQSTITTESQWHRGTILNYDKLKDVHLILMDGENIRKEYKLSEVIFRLVETEEEWVDVGDREMFNNVRENGHS